MQQDDKLPGRPLTAAETPDAPTGTESDAEHPLRQYLVREQAFERELTALINKYSRENDSNTPDFVLADFLRGCLMAFNIATRSRETWYGRGGLPELLAEGRSAGAVPPGAAPATESRPRRNE